MKKFLTLMALLVGGIVTASADSWYVVGDMNEWTYTPSQSQTITPMSSEDNCVTFTIDLKVSGEQFFCISNGDGTSWDDFNSNHRWGINNQVVTLDTDYILQQDNFTMKVAGDGSNYRFTFVPEVKKLTVTKLATPVENATINSVEIHGLFDSWGSGLSLSKVGDSNSYTETLDLTGKNTYIDIKLVVNGSWLGYDSTTGNSPAVTLDAPANWISDDGTNNHNFRLNHPATHYDTYTITATWVPNANAVFGWTLKVEGKDATPKNTYTVTFVNGKKWDDVYAYVWNGDGATAEKLEGNWPGKEISTTGNTVTYNGEALDIYSYTYEGYSAPEKIIFNNGKAEDASDKEQTGNLTFEANKQYLDAVEYVPVYAVVGSNLNESDKLFFTANFTEAPSTTDLMAYDAAKSRWTETFSNVYIEAQTVKFKVISRPYLESTSVSWYPDGNNKTIDITETGYYNITIIFDGTDVSSICYPATESFTIGTSNWATAITHNAVDFSQASNLKAYLATVSDNYVTLTEAGQVPAGTPIVLNGTTEAVPTLQEAAAVTNDLKGNNEYSFNIYSDHTNNYYGLTMVNNKATFAMIQKPTGSDVVTIPAGKAYLIVDPNTGSNAARELNVVFADEANSINSVIADRSVEGIFNLNGQRVAAPAKGLYIVKGKKIILK